ncbi:exocyst complex component Sec10-like protein [Lentinula aciculospora]|uniref:Exocyst complex component Sec10-like protein n=1 Tax=Lentinula aciculospora TaxID=153920 RepID=A0A9W9AWN6_9AGAR|nr:exocyst complex component Sec10-like protein [Lentinula aciculospora]
MDKFKTLEPLKLYSTAASVSPIRKATVAPQFVGKLPSNLHLLILSYLPVPDFPAYARCSHATAALAESEMIWEKRWTSLKMDNKGLGAVLDDLEEHLRGRAAESRAAAPPTITVDDEFGDFASVDVPSDEMGDFVGAFQNPTTPMSASLWTNSFKSTSTFRAQYIRAHNLLKPLIKTLSSPPHIILDDLAAAVTSSLRLEASTLRLLFLFLSHIIQPVRKWREYKATLRSAMDRFDANLLAAFDKADEKGDENGMREAADSSWLVWDGADNDWEMGKVWAEKREIFYDQSWDPLANFTEDRRLAFDAMDDFMSLVLNAISEHGSRAVRVFPAEAGVLISFSERVASDVVGEYISPVLTRAREISIDIFLKATAASFREAWKMVDTIMAAGGDLTSRTKAEDVVFRMFEPNMDEYLDEETEAVKPAFEGICKGWDRQASERHINSGDASARFLTSHNPSQVKRNVLASFANVLLLPVTIVPRTVGAVGGALVSGGTAVGGAAAQGIAMLNPQRWGGAGGGGWGTSNVPDGYQKHRGEGNEMMFDIGTDEDDEEEKDKDEPFDEKHDELNLVPPPSAAPLSAGTLHTTSTSLDQMDQMDTLLSLDVALELIHTCRESLKRLETFAAYPDRIGDRVRDTIEEVFMLLLHALGDGHVKRGFSRATARMTSYKPAEHEETTSVAPLLQFFELVHIGDTIQSMVQVYFDKEMACTAPHIDKNDFLNSVVREKKRFENSLDDSVAGGLNAGTEVLMNQVEHIILKLTAPREYYPPENTALDLKPTKGCREAIKCLEMHCKLLKGSTSKEVLEVFHQEVGIRLIAILQKHIKRQIISLSGGFQVIADLNAYHAFITTLKVPPITADFAHLKMLGHVYVVEDAKDLAQIVRDVTRYGGAYRPEDIYEFIQRRSDWKKIEKTVDKTMYNLSFKEDCIIC